MNTGTHTRVVRFLREYRYDCIYGMTSDDIHRKCQCLQGSSDLTVERVLSRLTESGDIIALELGGTMRYIYDPIRIADERHRKLLLFLKNNGPASIRVITDYAGITRQRTRDAIKTLLRHQKIIAALNADCEVVYDITPRACSEIAADNTYEEAII